MNLLQYSYEFDDDFDMAAIRERIAAKRQLINNLPGLSWKAWLLSDSRGKIKQPKTYAPLYLFEAMPPLVAFMAGPIYKGVTDSFGWTVPFQGPWNPSKPFNILAAQSCSLHIAPLHTHADFVEAAAEDVMRFNYEIAHVRMLDISKMQARTYIFWSTAAEEVPLAHAELIYEIAAVSAPAGA